MGVRMRPCECGRCGLEMPQRLWRKYHARCPHRAGIILAQQQAARAARIAASGEPHDLTDEEIDAIFQQALAQIKANRKVAA